MTSIAIQFGLFPPVPLSSSVDRTTGIYFTILPLNTSVGRISLFSFSTRWFVTESKLTNWNQLNYLTRFIQGSSEIAW